MQTHRILSGLTIFLMIASAAVGYFLVAQPQLAAANTANAQLVDAQSQISSTQAVLASLKNEQKQLPALKRKLNALEMSIPSNIDGAEYIRGLNDLAGSAGVTITALKVSDPVAYVSPAPAPAPAANSSATPSPAPSATPAAGTTAPVVTGWIPTTDPLITGSNFVDIPVTVTTLGSWDASLSFTKGLQSGKRLFLVTGISIKQADDGSSVTTTITGFIYALIDPRAAAAEAAAEKAASATPTPTPTPTPTVSTSPNPSGSSTPTPTTSPTP